MANYTHIKVGKYIQTAPWLVLPRPNYVLHPCTKAVPSMVFKSPAQSWLAMWLTLPMIRSHMTKASKIRAWTTMTAEAPVQACLVLPLTTKLSHPSRSDLKIGFLIHVKGYRTMWNITSRLCAQLVEVPLTQPQEGIWKREFIKAIIVKKNIYPQYCTY